MTEAFPLQWPAGKPCKRFPGRSKFGERSIDVAMTILREESRSLGVSNMALSSNLRLRNDGLPDSDQTQPHDPGVAVDFTCKKKPMCCVCDRRERIQDNIDATALTIEALRGIERWGSGSMIDRAPSPDS